MHFRTVIRTVGKGLITTGVLLFLFVGYQLWGTGLTEQRQQRALATEFSQRLRASSPTPDVAGREDNPPAGQSSAPGDAPTLSVPDPRTGPAVGSGVDLGEAVARLEIPRLDLDKLVVEGVGVEELKKGPGRYPGTALPGELGNAAIAGHRTTYGAPFYRLNELETGDPIFITTPAGRYRYDVSELMIVTPDDAWVLDPTDDNRLTLTTCHPRYSAEQRLIVVAQLTNPPRVAPPDRPAPARPSEPRPPMGVASEAGAGLSGREASKAPVMSWGAAAAAVGLAARLAARRRRRWLVYAAATPVFLLVLFQFFESVATLLPANV